jgi:protein-tyrosine phosphatase
VRVVFVCTGNICRSAFAQVSLAARLSGNPGVVVGSAGVMALVDSPMDPPMAAEAVHRGLDPTAHRARQLTGRILKEADIVMVFGPEHVDWIANGYPEHVERVVSLGQAAAVLAAQPRRALIRVQDLVTDVRQQRPEVAEEDWIADPYHQGIEAAERAAERIWADTEVLARKIEWSV